MRDRLKPVQCCLRGERFWALGPALAALATLAGVGCDGAATLAAGLISGFAAQLQLAFAGMDAGLMVSLIIF